jgi:hypothetical protein
MMPMHGPLYGHDYIDDGLGRAGGYRLQGLIACKICI